MSQIEWKGIMTTKKRVHWTHKLEELYACREAIEWAKSYRSFPSAWKACKRGDWMLWLCVKGMGQEGWPTHPQIVLIACDCAELSLKYVKEGEKRPKAAIETARRWARGKATIEEIGVARRDADAAAYAAADAATDAAYAAAADAAMLLMLLLYCCC